MLILFLFKFDKPTSSGLAGANEWESATCDMIVDCINDTRKPLVTLIYLVKDEKEKVSPTLSTSNIKYDLS